MKRPLRFNYTFSSEDVQAIVAALPLVPAFRADTELQQHINESLCASAASKLLNRSTCFIPNEVRVIALSITLAKELLAGHIHLDVTPETLAEIKPYLFAYNRLDTIFSPLLDPLDT